jgi:hypothetical protein
MDRISERISSAISTLECPGCGKRVVPIVASPPGAGGPPASPSDQSEEGKRWSFIWRPPSGAICPECFFPLARYVRRLKWVRTFSAGLVLLVGALMLFILSLLNPASTWAGSGARLVVGIGGLVTVVGIGGIVLGGQRSDHDQLQP